MRFKIATLLILCCSLILPYLMPVAPALGVTVDDLQQAVEEKERLQAELDSQKNQSRTLEQEISYTENQIRLNELEIQDTQGQIQATQALLVETNNGIGNLNERLSLLDETVKRMTEVAEARIRDAYKMSRVPEFGVLIQADNFSGALKTYQYLKELEAEDARILGLVNQNVKEYSEQKANLEKLKNEKETLTNQLLSDQERIEVQQSELDSARNYKDQLLADSKGEESRYAQLLAENEARIASMRRILAGGGGGQYLGYFEQGQVVGHMGSTGCSTGTHLHYGYIVGGGFVNPWPYLNSMTKPVGDGIYISQDYNGSYHNGIDWAGPENSPLYATKAGTATLEVAYTMDEILASSWCPSWAKPYVHDNQWEIWLRHNDGTISVYAHVNPW